MEQEKLNEIFEIMLGDLDQRLNQMELKLNELMKNPKYKEQ